MKSLKQFAGITLFAVLACAGLQAQTVDLTAAIPFDFTVGRTLMPAGQYTIHGDGVIVSLREVDGLKPANTYAMTIGGSVAKPNASPRLRFHRYGNQYFLASIQSSSISRELPTAGPEKELAKRMGNSLEASVLAARK